MNNSVNVKFALSSDCVRILQHSLLSLHILELHRFEESAYSTLLATFEKLRIFETEVTKKSP